VHTGLSQLSKPVERMVLEPPASGMDRQTTTEIVRLQPARIAYLSEDPATLARDARLLTAAGFQLLEVQPVDLFPHTFHIGAVASFAHRSAR
jgi:23S rRNA (uracil1939-C5)-methyltransferase